MKENLADYGNLPEYVRKSLMDTGDTEDASDEVNDEVADETQGTMDDEPSQPAENHEPNSEPRTVIDADEEYDNPRQDDNAIKAWKGRLNKEQQAHKATENKYLAEVNERQRIEQEKQALQKELETLKAQQANTQSAKPKTGKPNNDTLFTDEELDDLEFSLGEQGKSMADRLRHQSQGNQTQDNLPLNIDELIDKKFQQEREREYQARQEQAFSKALTEQVPELQGLFTDNGFTDFLRNKPVDFAGNTAETLVSWIGQTKNIEMLPKLKALVDEYTQTTAPKKERATAPPTSASAAVSRKAKRAKKALTPAVREKMHLLMNTGQVDKLRELQDEYDI